MIGPGERLASIDLAEQHGIPGRMKEHVRELGLSEDVVKRAVYLARLEMNAPDPVTPVPRSIIAGALYAATLIEEEAVTQRDIQEIVGVAPATIRKVWPELVDRANTAEMDYEMRKELEEFTFGERTDSTDWDSTVHDAVGQLEQEDGWSDDVDDVEISSALSERSWDEIVADLEDVDE